MVSFFGTLLKTDAMVAGARSCHRGSGWGTRSALVPVILASCLLFASYLRRYSSTMRFQTSPNRCGGVLNETIRDLHHFNEVDLIAIRCLTRIFPDQQALTIGKPFLRPVPAHQCIGSAPRTFFKERTNLLVPVEHTTLAVIEDGLHERSLQHCSPGIERASRPSVSRNFARSCHC
jgi:hypothetical protein